MQHTSDHAWEKREANSQPEGFVDALIQDKRLTRDIKKSQTWQDLRAIVIENEIRFNAVHVSASITHLAQLLHNHEGSYQKEDPGLDGFRTHLLHLMDKWLSQSSPRGLANGLWAIVRLGHAPGKRWLARYLAATSGRLSLFKPQELSNILWSLAILGYMPPQAWRVEYQAATRAMLEEFSPQGLANVLWGMSQLGWQLEKPWSIAVAESVGHLCADGDLQAIAMVLKACGKLGVNLEPDVVQQALTAVARELPGSGERELVSVMWTVAHGGLPASGGFWQLCLTAVDPHLPHLTPQHLAVLGWSLAKGTDHTPQPWWSQFLGVCDHKLSQFSDHSLSVLLMGLSRLTLTESVPWLASLGHRLQPRLAQLPCHCVCAFLSCASRWGMDRQDPCLKAMVAELQQKHYRTSPQMLIGALVALERLQYVTNEEWVRGWLDALQSRLHLFSRQQLGTACATLCRMRLRPGRPILSAVQRRMLQAYGEREGQAVLGDARLLSAYARWDIPLEGELVSRSLSLALEHIERELERDDLVGLHLMLWSVTRPTQLHQIRSSPVLCTSIYRLVGFLCSHLAEMSLRDLCMFLAAVGPLGANALQGNEEAVVLTVYRLSPSLTAVDSVDLLWGLTRAKVAIPASLHAMLVHAALRQLERLSYARQALLTWSISQSDHGAGADVLSRLIKAQVATMPRANVKDLMCLVVAWARLKYPVGQEWLDRFTSRLTQVLPAVGAQRLPALCLAAAAAGLHRPKTNWMEGLLRELNKHLPHYGIHQLVDVLLAVAGMSPRGVDQDLMEGFLLGCCTQVERQMGQARPVQLERAVWALIRLRYPIDDVWLAKCLDRITNDFDQLPSRRVITLLRSLLHAGYHVPSPLLAQVRKLMRHLQSGKALRQLMELMLLTRRGAGSEMRRIRPTSEVKVTYIPRVSPKLQGAEPERTHRQYQAETNGEHQWGDTATSCSSSSSAFQPPYTQGPPWPTSSHTEALASPVFRVGVRRMACLGGRSSHGRSRGSHRKAKRRR